MKNLFTFCLVIMICSGLQAKSGTHAGELYSIDLAMNLIVSPVNGAFLSDQEVVSVMIANTGTQTAGPFSLSYQLGSVVVTENFPGSIAVNDTVPFSFIQKADFSDPGLHLLKVWLTMTSDENHYNDTLELSVQNIIATYCPSAATNSGSLDIGFVSLNNLITAFLGPIELNPMATATYTDNTIQVAPANLICGGQYTLKVQPFYTQLGIQNSCCVYIDWNADGQYDWQTENVYSAMQSQFFFTPHMGFITVPTDAHTGLTGMRVIVANFANPLALGPCTSYFAGETEDYLVDIRNPGNIDAGVFSITEPVGLLTSQTQVEVKCTVRNYGDSTLISAILGYQIDDGPPAYENAVFNPIGFWEGFPFTFSLPLEVPTVPFQLKVFTVLNEDSYPQNDTCFMTYQVTPFCQPIVAVPDLPNMLPLPDDSLELRICRGTNVQFAANGLYPDNDSVYHQSNATSLFVWNFSDGTTDTGQIVTHTFPTAGYFPVYVEIIDIHQCSSGLTRMETVMVSPDSLVSVQNPVQICVNSPQVISVGHSPVNTLQINTTVSIQDNPVVYDSATLIPDVGNTGGVVISLPVTVTAAQPGSTLTSAGELEFVQINMEHSFVGDLEISLECPNGTILLLKSFNQTGGAYMGEPKGGVNHGNFDCLHDTCFNDPVDNPGGIGYNYRFSMNPVYSTMQTYASAGNMPNPPLGVAEMDSSSYLPEDPFSILEGCPLNGTWTLKVADYWAIDNGWVFNWTLGLNPLLLPEPVLEVGIDTILFSGPGIIEQQASQITILHTDPGSYSYSVTIIDDFGCSFDTVILVNVGIEFSANCSSNQYLVNPGTASFFVTPVGGIPPYQYHWSTGAFAQGIMAYTPVTTVYYVTVTDAQGCNAVDSVQVAIGLIPQGSPFLKNRMEWSIYGYGYIGYPFYTTFHRLVLYDSLINQVSYKKVWYCPDENPSNWHFEFLARDNGNQKIYRYDAVSQTERLIFDFSLQPGDSVLLSYSSSLPDYYVYAWSRDTVFVAGAYRPRIILGATAEVSGNPLDVWVEGLGSMLWGPVSKPPGYVGTMDTVLCIHYQQAQIYQKPGFTSCHLENVGISEPEKGNLVLYPNPVQDVSVFQVTTAINGPVVLEVYDVLGRLCTIVKERGMEELKIRKADYRSGLYFFKISDNQKEYFGKFIISK